MRLYCNLYYSSGDHLAHILGGWTDKMGRFYKMKGKMPLNLMRWTFIFGMAYLNLNFLHIFKLIIQFFTAKMLSSRGKSFFLFNLIANHSYYLKETLQIPLWWFLTYKKTTPDSVWSWRKEIWKPPMAFLFLPFFLWQPMIGGMDEYSISQWDRRKLWKGQRIRNIKFQES